MGYSFYNKKHTKMVTITITAYILFEVLANTAIQVKYIGEQELRVKLNIKLTYKSIIFTCKSILLDNILKSISH